mgnify:CR=1 FL=1
MGKKESTTGIVRIGVTFAELVVHSMVADPDVNVILQCNCLTYHEEDAQRQLGLVRSVSPQSVSACSD